MASSLSNLVNIFLKEFIKSNVNTGIIIKKYCDSFLKYMNFKDDLTEYKCSCCNNNYRQMFDGKLKE